MTNSEFYHILGRASLVEIQCASPDMSLELLDIGRASMMSLQGSLGELCSVYSRVAAISFPLLPGDVLFQGWLLTKKIGISSLHLYIHTLLPHCNAKLGHTPVHILYVRDAHFNFWLNKTSEKLYYPPSHLTPCLKIPCITCPQRSQKVGTTYEWDLKRWGMSILNLSFST